MTATYLHGSTRMDTMNQPRIEDAIETAVTTACDFVVVYHDHYGRHVDFGRRMTRPVPNSVIYDRWEGSWWQTTGLLYTSEVVAMWTEHDYCSCGFAFLNLDNWDDTQPYCDLCAREGFLSAQGDALREDGGI